MSQHTPGPWRIGDDDGYIYDKDNVIVATVMDDADARLIAAAPMMLDLVHELIAFRAVAEQEHDPILLHLTHQARAILRDVEG